MQGLTKEYGGSAIFVVIDGYLLYIIVAFKNQDVPNAAAE